MSEIKNGGLDQYGAGLFEQQQFGTAGVEGVIYLLRMSNCSEHVQTNRKLGIFCRVEFS